MYQVTFSRISQAGVEMQVVVRKCLFRLASGESLDSRAATKMWCAALVIWDGALFDGSEKMVQILVTCVQPCSCKFLDPLVKNVSDIH